MGKNLTYVNFISICLRKAYIPTSSKKSMRLSCANRSWNCAGSSDLACAGKGRGVYAPRKEWRTDPLRHTAVLHQKWIQSWSGMCLGHSCHAPHLQLFQQTSITCPAKISPKMTGVLVWTKAWPGEETKNYRGWLDSVLPVNALCRMLLCSYLCMHTYIHTYIHT